MAQRTSRILLGIAALLLLCVSLISTGCSDSSGSSNNSTTGGGNDYGGNYFPKMGTTYTYHAYQTDSMGVKVPNTDTTWTAFVVSDNANYMGKSKVFQVSDNGTNNYYTYEHNGDVDLYLDQSALGIFALFLGNTLNQWFTFPTASHYKSLGVFDTTINLQGLGNIRIDGHIDYLGDEQLTVGSEILTASKCILKVNSLLVNYQQTFWFVPKLGYFAKMTTSTSALSIPGFGGGFTSGSVQELTSYTLK